MNKQNWPFTNHVDPNIYNERTDWPKISIVTPSYNQGKYIEETILSILNQNYPNLEYIIIDGGSMDNTVEIIKKYQDRITYWVSEPDKGQVDAINKGLEKCTGDLFNWINSDDYLERDALFFLGLNFQKGYSFAAPIYTFSNVAKSTVQNKNLIYDDYLTLKDVYNQPGFWFDLARVKKIGPLDVKYHYAFDRIYMIKYLKNYTDIIYIDNPLVNFREHDASKTVSSWYKFYEELLMHYKILHKELNDARLNKIINNYYLPQYVVAYTYFHHKSTFKRLKHLMSHLVKAPVLITSRYYIGALKNIFFLKNV